MIKIKLTENENHEICDLISKISPYVRFVGIISKTGELLSYFRREGIEPLLDQKKSLYQFAQIAIKNELEEQFDEQLGETEFVWEERNKIQTLAFSVNSKKVWITIDKNVIRTEVIRIIDGCLPIVKRYS
jgi:heme oxygenase